MWRKLKWANVSKSGQWEAFFPNYPKTVMTPPSYGF